MMEGSITGRCLFSLLYMVVSVRHFLKHVWVWLLMEERAPCFFFLRTLYLLQIDRVGSTILYYFLSETDRGTIFLCPHREFYQEYYMLLSHFQLFRKNASLVIQRVCALAPDQNIWRRQHRLVQHTHVVVDCMYANKFYYNNSSNNILFSFLGRSSILHGSSNFDAS